MKSCLVFLVLCLIPASYCHAFSCGNKFIMPGMNMDQVLEYCGEPNQADRETDIIPGTRSWQSPYNGKIYSWSSRREINRERWVYNFGRNKFMQILIFEDGVLKSVKAGPRGY